MPHDVHTLVAHASNSDPVEEQSDEQQVYGCKDLVTLSQDFLADSTEAVKYVEEEADCIVQVVEAGIRSLDAAGDDNWMERKAQDRGFEVHINREQLQLSCIFFFPGD